MFQGKAWKDASETLETTGLVRNKGPILEGWVVQQLLVAAPQIPVGV